MKYVEVSWRDESGEPMFTEVYANGQRVSYWLPFWSALWEIVKLIFSGVEVRDRIGEGETE